MSARGTRRGVWMSAHYPTAARFFSNDSNDRWPPGLRVPGFGGLPVDVELMAEERFAHGFANWAQARLTAREVAMLRLMNDITDRPGWDDAVFNETIIASWRDEARSTRGLISDATWGWCLAELRDTAQVFRETRCIDVFNSASGVCKADGVISSDVLDVLRAGVDALVDEQKASAPLPSQGTGHDIIDPTLFLLAYGATSVVLDSFGRGIPLEDIFSSISQRAPPPPPPQTIQGRPEMPPPLEDPEGDFEEGRRWAAPDNAQKYFWSPGFQVLPCDIQFTQNGSGVTISSYINNLHPGRYAAVYKAIESVIAAAIPMWNRVLVKQDNDRLPPRIRTYGPLIEPQNPPSWYDRIVQLQKSRDEDRSGPAYQEALSLVEQYFAQPEPPVTEMLPTRLGYPPEPLSRDISHLNFLGTIHYKLERLRHTVHPEPGVSYTYEDWKAGKANQPIVPGRFCPSYDHPHQRGAKLGPLPDDGRQPFVLEHADHIQPPQVDLATSFATRGLQVIVKLTRTTLTPNKNPRCKAEEWHVDGMLNEHLVAGAVLVFNSENVTTPALDFRVEADLDPFECGHLEPTEQRALETTFGLTEGALVNRTPAVQEMGSVKFPDDGKRLVAYPHGMQHRMGAVELVDKSAPGHLDVLELWLVDPHYRVCSTRNVPPQRHDWWLDAVLQSQTQTQSGSGADAGWKWPRPLPGEILQNITAYTADFPVSVEEARRWQQKRREHEELCQEAVQFCVDGYMFLEYWRT